MDSEPVPSNDQQSRRAVYTVMEDDDLSLAEKRRQLLRIGVDYLDVADGHVEVFSDEESHEIVESVGDDDIAPVGSLVDHETSFCRRTVEESGPLALSDVEAEAWADDPAYLEHDVSCYLGATVRVDGEQYGTVCFTDTDARERSFEPSERAFVELIARTLGRALENARHERALEDQKRLLARRRREVERNEAKYASLLRAAPDAIFLVDAATGLIAEVNEAAADMTGYDRDALRWMPVVDLHPDDDRYGELFETFLVEEVTRSEFEDGTPIEVQRADGERVPVEISATTVELGGDRYVQGIVRDVSDRRARERELRLKDRALEEAAVGVTISEAGGEDNDLVYVNPRFEALTGYDRERVLGQDCRFLQGASTDQARVDELGDAIDAAEPVTTELLNYRADGTPFWNQVTVTPVDDGRGETTHYLGFQRDVTARKRRERLLGVLDRVLRHNLRNDMTVVAGLAEAIATEADGDVAARADRIAATAHELTSLSQRARELRTVATGDSTPRPRDVVDTVVGVAEDLRAEHPAASVRLGVPASATAVATADLRTAVAELCDNAVEHAGPEPTVRLDVEETGDGWVRVRVTDDGPGLPEAEQAVLRSGQETQLQHGSGLGLWLVNWVVTAAAGRVAVDVDGGTTVSLYLPRDDGDSGVVTRAAFRA